MAGYLHSNNQSYPSIEISPPSQEVAMPSSMSSGDFSGSVYASLDEPSPVIQHPRRLRRRRSLGNEIGNIDFSSKGSSAPTHSSGSTLAPLLSSFNKFSFMARSSSDISNLTDSQVETSLKKPPQRKISVSSHEPTSSSVQERYLSQSPCFHRLYSDHQSKGTLSNEILDKISKTSFLPKHLGGQQQFQ